MDTELLDFIDSQVVSYVKPIFEQARFNDIEILPCPQDLDKLESISHVFFYAKGLESHLERV